LCDSVRSRKGTNNNKEFFGHERIVRMTMKHQIDARKREELEYSESIGTCRVGMLVASASPI
jgi:hypothetical protein